MLLCDYNCQGSVLDQTLQWWLFIIARNDSCIGQRCLECPLNNCHSFANKPWHSMTQARICQLPDSEWQPKCHQRRDACFHSSPSGASPRGQQMTAGYLPGLSGDEAGWHSGRQRKAGPEEDLDRVVNLSGYGILGRKEQQPELAFLEETPKHTPNREGLEEFSLRAAAQVAWGNGPAHFSSVTFADSWLHKHRPGVWGVAIGRWMSMLHLGKETP